MIRNPSSVDLREIQAERVCLIKPSSLGDVIQALPVLTALRRRFPSAKLAWVLNRGYERLLEGHPHLDEIIPFDRARAGLRSPAAPLEWMRFLARLRVRRF